MILDDVCTKILQRQIELVYLLALAKILYKMKIWRRIYFGGLVNYKNPPN